MIGDSDKNESKVAAGDQLDGLVFGTILAGILEEIHQYLNYPRAIRHHDTIRRANISDLKTLPLGLEQGFNLTHRVFENAVEWHRDGMNGKATRLNSADINQVINQSLELDRRSLQIPQHHAEITRTERHVIVNEQIQRGAPRRERPLQLVRHIQKIFVFGADELIHFGHVLQAVHVTVGVAFGLHLGRSNVQNDLRSSAQGEPSMHDHLRCLAGNGGFRAPSGRERSIVFSRFDEQVAPRLTDETGMIMLKQSFCRIVQRGDAIFLIGHHDRNCHRMDHRRVLLCFREGGLQRGVELKAHPIHLVRQFSQFVVPFQRYLPGQITRRDQLRRVGQLAQRNDQSARQQKSQDGDDDNASSQSDCQSPEQSDPLFDQRLERYPDS